MNFLKNDFTRYFTVGFLAGSIAVAAIVGDGVLSTMGATVAGEVVPAAIAAAPAR